VRFLFTIQLLNNCSKNTKIIPLANLEPSPQSTATGFARKVERRVAYLITKSSPVDGIETKRRQTTSSTL